ncbi:MAG: sigma-54-dependent transcriptional regulator [Planctomycetota bacterium]
MSKTKSPSPLPIRVLIVDNDPAMTAAMAESLDRQGYVCVVATSGSEGAKHIERDSFDVIITDLVMNDVDGMQLLSLANEYLPDAEVVMVTGHASVPKAVEAMQQGAYIFLEKPLTPSRLRAVVERAADAVRLRRDNLELNQRLDERFGYEGIVFGSRQMQQVMDRVRRIAPTDATVLITGGSGTGKELIAQAIHQNSPRKGKRLFPINCAAVAENLVESELFGHLKGAFTDARTDRVGAFEYANGGTLFLDEVGDMPRATQTKLLRVLEENRITRVGDNKPVDVNVRVLSATNRSLEDAVANGDFREDLYYRLKVVTVDLPPLASRPEDIVPLMEDFRRQFSKHHRKNTERFAPAVRRRFFSFDWPGNVRQLRNAVETMVVLDIDGVLDIDDLPPELADVQPREGATSSGLDHLIGQPLDIYEKHAIGETLKLTHGNREEAARILNIGARTLYRKLEKYGLG